MADPFFEFHETNLGQEPMVRLRFETTDPLEYAITSADLLTWPGFLYHTLAHKFYSDADLWWVIADANPIKRASDWQRGFVILIPKDYRSAIALNQQEIELRRRLY